jgi:hypothetical protein
LAFKVFIAVVRETDGHALMIAGLGLVGLVILCH